MASTNVGNDEEGCINDESYSGNVGVHLAVCRGNLALFQFLLKDPYLNINICDGSGLTALHYACGERYGIGPRSSCSVTFVTELLDHGANPAAKSKGEYTPLELAAGAGNVPAINTLLQFDEQSQFIDRAQRSKALQNAVITSLTAPGRSASYAEIADILLERGADLLQGARARRPARRLRHRQRRGDGRAARRRRARLDGAARSPTAPTPS